MINTVLKSFASRIMPKMDNVDVIKPKKGKNIGTVIFLHGSGGTGHLSKEWIQMLRKDISFSHLKILFPTAPLRPYTPLNGELSNVWFNRLQISPDCAEHLETINSMGEELKLLVRQEINNGIPPDKIIIGGFSMGGGMALHMGYRFTPEIAGVFALSSFLNHKSIVFETLNKKNESLPSLFWAHGNRDDLVPFEWGQETFNNLLKHGVNGQFHIVENAMHELKTREINLLYDWINKLIPDK